MKKITTLIFACVFLFSGCGIPAAAPEKPAEAPPAAPMLSHEEMHEQGIAHPHPDGEHQQYKKESVGEKEIAIFAGGCFWCVESVFDDVEGVYSAVSGYTDGTEANPTYKDVSEGKTGYTEAVRVTFNPTVISYMRLLDLFWHEIDPTDAGGQFADRGSQYRTGIYYTSEMQKVLAERSKQALVATGPFDGPIVTPIKPASEFYEAEEYHQDYHKKKSLQYKLYRKGSGRDAFLERTWKE